MHNVYIKNNVPVNYKHTKIKQICFISMHITPVLVPQLDLPLRLGTRSDLPQKATQRSM